MYIYRCVCVCVRVCVCACVFKEGVYVLGSVSVKLTVNTLFVFHFLCERAQQGSLLIWLTGHPLSCSEVDCEHVDDVCSPRNTQSDFCALLDTFGAPPLSTYGVALVSRIDKMIGLFCKRALRKRLYSAKETWDFIDPTDRSQRIGEKYKTSIHSYTNTSRMDTMRGGGLGSRPKKMYWEYLGDGVEYHLMSPTPRR